LDTSLDDLIAKDKTRGRAPPKTEAVAPTVFDRLGGTRGFGTKGVRDGRGGRDGRYGSTGRGGRGGHGGVQQTATSIIMRNMMRNRKVSKDAGGDMVVQLFDTEVVRVTKEGDILLNSGGYTTPTTLECINDTLGKYGFTVKAKGDSWTVTDGKSRLMRFYDGMVIDKRTVRETAPSPRDIVANPFHPAQTFRPANARFRPY